MLVLKLTNDNIRKLQDFRVEVVLDEIKDVLKTARKFLKNFKWPHKMYQI
jgi:hypothetical protein